MGSCGLDITRGCRCNWIPSKPPSLHLVQQSSFNLSFPLMLHCKTQKLKTHIKPNSGNVIILSETAMERNDLNLRDDMLRVAKFSFENLICGSSQGCSKGEGEVEEEEEYQVLTAVRSKYNEIVIVDTPNARMLLLDSTHNVHSMLDKTQKWTGSYWGEFASLPAVIPNGPVAILGLGGGTAAHLMLDLWPSLQLEGWEIDEILIHKAREHFGLGDLEKYNEAGGILHVIIDDALCPAKTDLRKYAGIVVDLFSEGAVLAQLQEVETWLELKERLVPEGRIMVNCGGISITNDSEGGAHPEPVNASTWDENSTIKALAKAFPGQLCWKRLPETQGANYLAMTGPLPDLESWSSMVSGSLKENVKHWKQCGLSQ